MHAVANEYDYFTAVLVIVRESQPVNLVGAYEDVITDEEKGDRLAATP